MDLEIEMPAGNNVYKLFFPYDDEDSIYLSTNMNRTKLADIYVGFEFYIEFNTKYGMESMIDVDVAAYLLCNLFGCSVFDRKHLHLLKSYEPGQHDIAEEYWVDIFEERERRCGDGYDRYIQNIMEYTGAEFVRKLCAYFDSEEVRAKPARTRFLSPEEIIERY